MKPYIFITKAPDKNGKFTFTEEELKKVLEKAYEDGYNEGFKICGGWWNTPITITPTNTPITITPNDVPNPYQVTCEMLYNTVGD